MNMRRFLSLTATVVSAITLTSAQTCVDNTNPFYVTTDDGTQKLKSCTIASKNPWGQCEKPEVRANCPKLCALCDGDVMCKIRADLQFPPEADTFQGFHSDFVSITKEGEAEPCYSSNSKTFWGCTFFGNDASINTMGSTLEKTRSVIRVYDARQSSLRIGVSHRFNEQEVMEDFDETVRSNLVIKVNGQMLSKSFRHSKNLGRLTHSGFDQVSTVNENVGFVNPEYNGDYFVDIDCDQQCNCNIVQKDAICRLKAQLKFDPIVDESNYGFRRDFVKASNENGATCSKESELHWCTVYGDAQILNFENQEYYDFNMASFMNIPDASDKTFKFHLGQVVVDDAPAEMYEDPATLYLYVNNELLKSYKRDIGQNSSTISVSCDDSCDCHVH